MILNNRIWLTVPFKKKDYAKAIKGSSWNKVQRMWSFPLKEIEAVESAFPALTKGLRTKVLDKLGVEDRICLEDKARENERDVAAAIADVPDPQIDFLLQPYEHQMTMLKCGLKFPQFAYFAEMGTGKTKVIIDLIRIRKKRTLIFAPKSVIYNWGEEVDKNSRMRYHVASGTKSQKAKALRDLSVAVVITNYETLKSFREDKAIWDSFPQVVLDESSRIKNHKAQRTKAILDVFENHQYKYILSGTPVTQGPTDLWPQMMFLNPNILGLRSFYTFRNYYVVMGGHMGYQPVGYKHLDELRSKVSKSSIQLKKENCLDLPEKVYKSHKLDMSKEVARQYHQMKEDLIVELDHMDNVTAQIVLTKLLRLQEITAGAYLEKEEDNEKLTTLLEIIDELLGAGRQVVVWARFRRSLSVILDALSDRGIAVSLIHGDIVDRQAEINKFQNRETKIFLGQESTGGLGINLTAGDAMIYYENTFSLEERKQSEDRIHRIGQKNTCLYIDIVYRGTVDETVLSAIHSKQSIATQLVESFQQGKYIRR